MKMKNMKKIGRVVFPSFSALAVLALGAWMIQGCGTGIGTPYTYSSTSTTGDYAEWTVTAGNVSAVWQVTDNTGAVKYTLNIQASCGAPDATYGYQTCTIYQATCTNGNTVCGTPPSGQFDMMAAPGVALFVHTPGSGTNNDQLHVGILKDNNGCKEDITGFYTYIRAGAGQQNLFGMYHADSNLINVNHADFQMTSGTQAGTPTIDYTTTDGTVAGDGNVTLTDSGCSGGVRTRGVGGTQTLRSMMTQSGLFMMDMPSGQGGMLSFRVDKAASITDFAGKSFAGIVFPDNGPASPMAGTGGSYDGTGVPFTVQFKNPSMVAVSNMAIKPVTVVATTATSPAYPNFSTALNAAPHAYSTNTVLSSVYANPSTIPGLFQVDGSFPDSGRVVLGAMKYNGKIIGFGAVYNYRDNTYTGPGGVNYTTAGLYNSGNFLLFEK